MSQVKRTTKDIERDIARLRSQLADDVGSLQVAVKRRLDWREQVRDHPWPALGAALALGFWLGAR